MNKLVSVFKKAVGVLVVILSIGACAVSVLAFLEVRKCEEGLAYDSTVLISNQVDEEPVFPPDFPVAVPAVIQLKIENGNIFVENPSFELLHGEAESVVVPFPDGRYSVQYDQAGGSVFTEISGCRVTVSVVDAGNVKKDAVYRFLSDVDGSIAIAAQKRVSSSAAVSVVISGIVDDEQQETVQSFVQSVYEKAAPGNGIIRVSVENLIFDGAWSENILIDSNVVSISTGDQTIYAAPYTMSLTGAGMTNELAVSDTCALKYGNYRDVDTGYMPFIYTQEDRSVIILATGADVLFSAFRGESET